LICDIAKNCHLISTIKCFFLYEVVVFRKIISNISFSSFKFKLQFFIQTWLLLHHKEWWSKLWEMYCKIAGCFQSWFVGSHPFFVGYIVCVIVLKFLFNNTDQVLSPWTHLTVSFVVTYTCHTAKNLDKELSCFILLFSQAHNFSPDIRSLIS
jgi:hypothetical protein